MDISKFKTKSELFTYLKENQEDLIYAKKSAIKEADSVSLGTIQIKGDVVSNKSNSDVDQTEIKVRAIINTTMVKDSHGDVHINGLWKKSIQENKMEVRRLWFSILPLSVLETNICSRNMVKEMLTIIRLECSMLKYH